jgi:hypothetical protein
VVGALVGTVVIGLGPQSFASTAHTVSVVSEGADPTGAADSTAAFQKAITDANAAHEAVWIPQGSFTIGTALQVDNATIEGAGDWYSQILSDAFIDNTSAVSGPVNLSDFAILGSTVGRHDDSTENAVNGSLGTGATVDGLWIQNTNVGLWLEYGNTDVTVENTEIFDTDADWINFNGNAIDSTVKDVLVRNTGDDGLAIWSYPAADSGDTFTDDTVEQPNLANGIAAYGGTDDSIQPVQRLRAGVRRRYRSSDRRADHRPRDGRRGRHGGLPGRDRGFRDHQRRRGEQRRGVRHGGGRLSAGHAAVRLQRRQEPGRLEPRDAPVLPQPGSGGAVTTDRGSTRRVRAVPRQAE